MSPWCAQAPLNLFACLSNTREVHPYLASDSVVGGILDVCEYRSKLYNGSTTTKVKEIVVSE